MVESGLTQDDVAARLGVRQGNTPDLNPRENLREILQQELDSERPSTSVQQLTERLKPAWATIARHADGAYCVENAESGGKDYVIAWRTHQHLLKER